MKKNFLPLLSTKSKKGFTLIEILVVVAILMIILLLFFFTSFRQLSKGRDGRRKSDLEKIKVAFEDYYNDHNCYPDTDVLNNCNGDSFRPYLDTIPCDPSTAEPYLYVASDGGICKGYKLLSKLENSDDPDIAGVGCDADEGCGYEDTTYNYGVAQGTGVFNGSASNAYTGITPEYSDDYYCLPEFAPTCKYTAHSNAELRDCPKVFDGPNGSEECNAECAVNPSIMCDPL